MHLNVFLAENESPVCVQKHPVIIQIYLCVISFKPKQPHKTGCWESAINVMSHWLHPNHNTFNCFISIKHHIYVFKLKLKMRNIVDVFSQLFCSYIPRGAIFWSKTVYLYIYKKAGSEGLYVGRKCKMKVK